MEREEEILNGMYENSLNSQPTFSDAMIEHMKSEVVKIKEEAIEWVKNKLKKEMVYNKIDLGLPSGTLWADRNIGATDEYDSGKYFQWGDTTPYDVSEYNEDIKIPKTEKQFNWGDYKFNSDVNSTNDDKIVFDLTDDSAYINMGSDWRMPTEEQFHELVKETILNIVLSDGTVIDCPMDEQNEVFKTTCKNKTKLPKAFKFTNKNDLNKFILIPVSGYRHSGLCMFKNIWGMLWTSSICREDIKKGLAYTFNLCEYSAIHLERCSGIPIRGVVNK